MASTEKEKRLARDYYKKNRTYRENKIEKTAAEHKAHRLEHNKKAREYYASNPSYRKYKIKYAAEYRKNRRGK